MWLDAGGAHLLGHVPPPGTRLQGERHRRVPVEAGQPPGQMLPIRRRDPAPLQPPRLHLDVVERQLLPVNVQTTYDRHQGLLTLRDHRCPTHPRATPSYRAFELRRPPEPTPVKAVPSAHRQRRAKPMHVISHAEYSAPDLAAAAVRGSRLSS